MGSSKAARWAGVVAVALLATPSLATGQQSGEQVPKGETAQLDLLDEAIDLRGTANVELSESQSRIETLSDETDSLLTRYQAALRQHESLRTYNRQLRQLIASQQLEELSLEAQVDQIELVSRDVTPLMLRMIDALAAFVDLDVPFLEEERTQRIRDLHQLMRRADVTEAEKYRRIMEAYQIENEYGRTIEAYRSTVKRDGRDVTVNFLRVGRIALVYQTLDESEAGSWNQETRTWDPVDDSLRSSIRNGLRIARKQAAPDLIRLPIGPPQKEEG